MKQVPANGREAFEQGFSRGDDPFWNPHDWMNKRHNFFESNRWCREWDEAYREVHGDTSKWPFKSKTDMS